MYYTITYKIYIIHTLSGYIDLMSDVGYLMSDTETLPQTLIFFVLPSLRLSVKTYLKNKLLRRFLHISFRQL
jgi:hypothetical protein